MYGKKKKRSIAGKLLPFVLTGALIFSLSGCGENYVEKAKRENSLVIAVNADVDTLHLSDYSTTVESNILDQIYDPLIWVNPDGTGEPEPRLAESYEVSDDGMTYTFHLRDDVFFHDGTPVTAKDVVFSLEMYQNSEYQGSQVDGLDYAEAADDSTIVCHMQYPYSPFLMGIGRVHIGSEAYYEKNPEKFATEPIGSGPYKFVGRDKGSSLTLEAFEDYYGGVPQIRHVEYKVIPDETTRSIALQTGEVNFASIESSSILALKGSDRIAIEEVESSGFTYVSMNLEQEPFNNPKVRQAINYAIDRENIVNICYDGEADINSNLCAKSRFGYSDSQKQYDYDLAKARELLKEAGIKPPYDLGTMLVAEQYSDIATVLQNDLREVGLEVKIEVKEFNAYLNDLTQGNYSITALSMTLEGDTQMCSMALTTDYIGTANNARYSDPEIDSLFAQAGQSNDRTVREGLYNQIFTKVQEEAVYGVICNPYLLYAHNTELDCGEIPFEGFYEIEDFTWD